MVKSTKQDKLDVIQEKFPDLNVDWLMTGEGEMLKSAPAADGKDEMIVALKEVNASQAAQICAMKAEIERLRSDCSKLIDAVSRLPL